MHSQSGVEYSEHTAAQWDPYQKKNPWVVYCDSKPLGIVWFQADMSMKQMRDELVYRSGFAFDVELRRPS
jgi:hypothetical protein